MRLHGCLLASIEADTTVSTTYSLVAVGPLPAARSWRLRSPCPPSLPLLLHTQNTCILPHFEPLHKSLQPNNSAVVNQSGVASYIHRLLSYICMASFPGLSTPGNEYSLVPRPSHPCVCRSTPTLALQATNTGVRRPDTLSELSE